MIEKSTVLILGAGASIDYGYPSGRELTNTVKSFRPTKDIDSYKKLYEVGFSEKVLQEFTNALRFSGQISVDAFLERRPEFIEVGKAAIAMSLLRCENLDRMFDPVSFDNGSWYEHFFQQLSTPKFEDIVKNKIGIITFNYDRSLEVYLHEAVKHSYGKSDNEVANIFLSIPIIHVHGKLGKYPWEEGGRLYKKDNDVRLSDIRQAASEIRIISEAKDIQEGFEAARELITKSSRLIFIGFGYHSQNIERLQIGNFEGQLLYGSSYGLTPLERTSAEKMLTQILRDGGNQYNPRIDRDGNSACMFLRKRINF